MAQGECCQCRCPFCHGVRARAAGYARRINPYRQLPESILRAWPEVGLTSDHGLFDSGWVSEDFARAIDKHAPRRIGGDDA